MIDRRTVLVLSACGAMGHAVGQTMAATSRVPLLSTAAPGAAVATGWQHQEIPGVAHPNSFAVVEVEQERVLQVRSTGSASTWIARLNVDPVATPYLTWRWRVAHALRKSDIRSRENDDYAARVYVFFDLPVERLSFGDRLRIQTARLMSKTDMPTAALCYVWGNVQEVGESGWNAYTDRLRMIVVDSGNAHAGQWRQVQRHIGQDWAEAFGGPVPRVSGIALGCDTDNTGDNTVAWFGDLAFVAAP